jgi:hypothetical protein
MKVAFMTLMIPWYVAALGAAVVWGIHYPLIDLALKRVSLMTVLLLTAIPVLFLVPFYRHVLVADARTLARLGTGERWAVLSVAVTSLVATVRLFVSIGRKNATVAGLIEITYPLFIIFFTWLLFREVHLNWTSAFGTGAVADSMSGVWSYMVCSLWVVEETEAWPVGVWMLRGGLQPRGRASVPRPVWRGTSPQAVPATYCPSLSSRCRMAGAGIRFPRHQAG